MSETSIPDLVAEGARLKQTIKDGTARLKEIEAFLIENAGVGAHNDSDGNTATVVQPTDSIALPADDESTAKVREIMGDNFGKLFERSVSHKPVKGFREVAAALLGKRSFTRLINLCSVAKSAYVKWS